MIEQEPHFDDEQTPKVMDPRKRRGKGRANRRAKGRANDEKQAEQKAKQDAKQKAKKEAEEELRKKAEQDALQKAQQTNQTVKKVPIYDDGLCKTCWLCFRQNLRKTPNAIHSFDGQTKDCECQNCKAYRRQYPFASRPGLSLLYAQLNCMQMGHQEMVQFTYVKSETIGTIMYHSFGND